MQSIRAALAVAAADATQHQPVTFEKRARRQVLHTRSGNFRSLSPGGALDALGGLPAATNPEPPKALCSPTAQLNELRGPLR